MREIAGRRDEFAAASTATVRPAGSFHDVRFGPHGALILSVDVEDELAAQCARGWSHTLSMAHRQIVGSLLAVDPHAHSANVDDFVRDFVHTLDLAPTSAAPPRWLLRARERLIHEPAAATIQTLAQESGVHRAHFARAFHQWFGTTPSLFRRHYMMSRAIAGIAAGQAPTAAALSAGFADQSHYCRTMRRTVGITPGNLRQLFLHKMDALNGAKGGQAE